MPPIQTTYPSNFTASFAGMVANQEVRNVISRNVADAAGLAFGVPVFQGANDNAVTATPGTLFRGISIVDKNVAPFSMATGVLAAAFDAYAALDNAGILTFGVVWVIASVAVIAGEPVYVTPAGLFTDVANGDIALPRATFDSSAAIGTLVKVRLS